MQSPFQFIHHAPNDTDKKQPAIFLFHGLGSNEHDLLQLVDTFKGRCHIFSVQGPITHKPGYAFYTFEEEGKPTRDIFDKVVKAAQVFVQEAAIEFNVDIEQIYVVGFNQGAVIAQTISLVMGKGIRGTVALSGFVPEFVAVEYNKLPHNNANVLITHGEYDYVYPVVWGKESAELFESNGANVELFIFEDGHGVTPAVLQKMQLFIEGLLPSSIN